MDNELEKTDKLQKTQLVYSTLATLVEELEEFQFDVRFLPWKFENVKLSKAELKKFNNNLAKLYFQINKTVELGTRIRDKIYSQNQYKKKK